MLCTTPCTSSSSSGGSLRSFHSRVLVSVSSSLYPFLRSDPATRAHSLLRLPSSYPLDRSTRGLPTVALSSSLSRVLPTAVVLSSLPGATCVFSSACLC